MWRSWRIQLRWLWRRVALEESGATTLEWTLLLAAIAIPSLAITRLALEVLLAYFEMMSTLNALPFP